MTPKLRKKILWLLLPIIGGSIISSIVVTELNGSIGKINFKNAINKQTEQFIKTGTDTQSQLTPVSLITELAKDPSSIPLLMRGFATEIAKSVFDGKLFEKTQYAQIGKSFTNYLKGTRGQIQHSIKQKRNTDKRVKKDWVSDNEKYLSSLRDFILGKIDSSNIENYYKLKDEHSFTWINTIQRGSLPFIGFLMGSWISKFKAGHYVHELLPYAENFQESTKDLYAKKFKNVNLPEKPNFYFPDFDTSKIEKFKEVIDLFDQKTNNWLDLVIPHSQAAFEKKLKEKSTIHWISSTNTPQKNLVLKYISKSNNSSSSFSSSNATKPLSLLWQSFKNLVRPSFNSWSLKLGQDWCKASDNQISNLSDLFLDLKQNPLKLFCITENSNGIEFLVHASNSKLKTTNQIVFWRDQQGFNLIFPTKKLEQKNEVNDLFQKNKRNKSQLVSEFKEYIKENFPYLLLKYYLHIKGCNSKPKKPICCCEEIIKSLIELWDLSKKLTELNDNLKVWDNRTKNNYNLKTIDYSQSQQNNYFAKLGTISPNPPSFLQQITAQDKIKQISSSIKSHLSKIESYFNSKKGQDSELKAIQKSGTENNKDSKYWTFSNETTKSPKDSECMKQNLAEFLLEKISNFELLKKLLLIPISFEKITESSQSQNKLDKLFEGEIAKFLKLSNGGSSNRAKRQTAPSSTSNNNLLELLKKAIKQELVLSKLETISDSFLYKLSTENSSTAQSNNSSIDFETIKDWLTINSLLSQPLKTADTLKKAQLRLLITSLYLMENSMKEYRELLKSIVKNELFGSYVFSLSWNKFCTQDESKNPIDPTSQQSSNGAQNFFTPVTFSSASRGSSSSSTNQEWNNSTLDSRTCIRNIDRYSVSSIKKNSTGSGSNNNNGEIKLMGFKGSISRASQLQLPRGFYEKILSFLLKEGHIKWENINSQIELIKSNRQFYDFVQQLTKINSAIGRAFELPNYRSLKEDTDQSKRAEALEWFGLTKRKELLKTFIKEYLFKEQASLQLISTNTDNSLSSKNKESFQGLMWDTNEAQKKNYIFSTKDENEGSAVAYLIQFTEDDLKDENAFTTFITKKLTPEMLIQDIVKKAQDKGLQSKAINHYLMRGSWATGDKVFNLSSDDYYLKKQFSSIIL